LLGRAIKRGTRRNLCAELRERICAEKRLQWLQRLRFITSLVLFIICKVV
jgi:hypothetical protein